MAIDKINNDILSPKTIQDSVKKATSGKKDNVHEIGHEVKKTVLEDKIIFSQDAKKLQETEVILQNALQKLHEMDEINEANLIGIKERIESDFYNRDEVFEQIITDVFPEHELRKAIETRAKAERYLPVVKQYDEDEIVDEAKLDEIRERIENGFYNTNEVFGHIADELLSVMEA